MTKNLKITDVRIESKIGNVFSKVQRVNDRFSTVKRIGNEKKTFSEENKINCLVLLHVR